MLQLRIGGKSIYWNLHASWAHMHLPGVNVYKYLYSDGSEDSLWVSLVVRSPQMTANLVDGALLVLLLLFGCFPTEDSRVDRSERE